MDSDLAISQWIVSPVQMLCIRWEPTLPCRDEVGGEAYVLAGFAGRSLGVRAGHSREEH